MSKLKVEFNEPRELSNGEWKILNKMLSADFQGKDIVSIQLKSAKVISYCPCGCKTIDIQVDRNLPQYEYEKRVPVELKVFSEDGVPIMASLHIANGYISELEIVRADSKAINDEIIFDNSIIEVH
jgi:hypothetical protein